MAGVHYKGSDTFCCSSDAPCDEMKSVWGKPAQSDAPSAEPRNKWLDEHPEREAILLFAEAYAALRTAKLAEEIQGLESEGDDILRAFNDAAAKVAQLERERAAFIERTRIAEADKVAAVSALSEARGQAIDMAYRATLGATQGVGAAEAVKEFMEMNLKLV